MIPLTLWNIFKRGSKTYFYSSLFFPRNVREGVFALYAFVRKADDFVDATPQKVGEFKDFVKEYHDALQGKISHDIVINEFIKLKNATQFPNEWVESFLHSMEMDTYKTTYQNWQEFDTYIYGSAEVIGLMMAKILHLPEESYPSAARLGRAMQYINFIRDVLEDTFLSRNYFPQSELVKYNIHDLLYEHALSNRENFTKFIHDQINMYDSWQKDAEEGFKFIPKRYRIAIKTASDMYRWTAQQIKKDPFVIFERKVKPPVWYIILSGLKNSL